MNAPLFFNVFRDSICRYIESKIGGSGFQLAYNIDGHLMGRRKPNGSQPCWILLHACDMVIFEKFCEQLQAVFGIVQQALEQWAMQMSISKTECMQLGRVQCPYEPLYISEHEKQQISKIRHLGSIQYPDLSTRAESSNRIASAANAWLKLSRLRVWDDDRISKGIKCTLYECAIHLTVC